MIAVRQKSTGYNQRSRLGTQIGRWKTVIGPTLKAMNFKNQQTEAKSGPSNTPLKRRVAGHDAPMVLPL